MCKSNKKNSNEHYWAYRCGYQDGVLSNSRHEKYANNKERSDLLEEYTSGYNDGNTGFAVAMDLCSKRIGYDRIEGLLDLVELHKE